MLNQVQHDAYIFLSKKYIKVPPPCEGGVPKGRGGNFLLCFKLKCIHKNARKNNPSGRVVL